MRRRMGLYVIIIFVTRRKELLRIGIILLLLVSCFFTPIFISGNTFAEEADGVVKTTFFGNVKDDGEGCGVYTILNLVLDIMTIGIGILGVLGIVIVGIKYMTAGGNEEQTRKAKRRLFEIVIGLILYVLLFAGLQWLLPGGRLNNNPSCAKISDSELADLESEKAGGDGSVSSSNGNKSANNYVGGSAEGAAEKTLTGKTKYEKKINSKPFKLNVKGAAKIKYTSSNERVAYVTKDGMVYPNDVGNAVITATSGDKKLEIKVKVGKRDTMPTIVHVPGNYVSKRKYKESDLGDYNYVFRYVNPVKAEKAADNAIASYNNKNIVGHRESITDNNHFTRELAKVGWDPSKIKSFANTACSQFVLAMAESVGIHQNNTLWAHKDAPGTINALTKETKHFYTLTGKNYTKDWTRLRRGDILVGDGQNGHIRHAIMIVK
ncbi:Ig-like domain-containing protein [Candidatus Saccharibacteria bacterium]|nr:Ig-like domain-containing protein [Candidatus Saccharibacteria bacterium]